MAGLPSLLLALFSTAALATPSFNHTKSIQWGSCLDQIRCINLTLPLDWDKPNGKQINVGIGMLPVADQSKRIGYLFTNPGGPGNSAIEDLSSNAGFWKSTKLHQYFDIIAPDPRGTAYSTPIRCDPAIWNVRVAEIPSTEAEFYHLNKTYSEMGGSCAKASGDILNYVDTVSVVKDFEAIRVALGDEPMNYLGFSYGAQLGAQYAEYFPMNIRALAIDGILDHSEPEKEAWLAESNGYEVTLNQFFDWCKQNSTCALRHESNLPDKFDALIDRANKSPIPAPACNDPSFTNYPCRANTTGTELLRTFQSYLVFPYAGTSGMPGWSGLASMLQQAMNSHNASFFAEPRFTSATNEQFSYAAIFCQDWYRTQWSATDFLIKRLVGSVASPHTRGHGEMWYLQAMCMNWPSPVNNPPHSYAPIFADRKMKTPILLTNALYDPETPIQWALTVLQQLGEDNAVLAIRNGSGHTSYYHEGATHNTIDDYMINLKVPANGKVLPD